LADDELFVKLQAEENMSIFGDVEDILTDVSFFLMVLIKKNQALKFYFFSYIALK
jgi:hypothetical protein